MSTPSRPPHHKMGKTFQPKVMFVIAFGLMGGAAFTAEPLTMLAFGALFFGFAQGYRMAVTDYENGEWSDSPAHTGERS